MNGFDVASAAVFAGSIVHVVAVARKPRRTLSAGCRLFRSVAALTIVALATASVAMNGQLTTTIFVQLSACMLLVAAVMHAFAWSNWLAK